MAQPEKYLNIKKQRGMTLLEIIIVLGIIGTIAAGVVILAQRAFDSKALSDLTSNINTVRTSMKDAYGPTGVYPTPAGGLTVALTDASTAAQLNATPVGKLISLGKLSTSEAKNNISNNYINVGGADIGTNGVRKAYFLEINGLNQAQCRNILTQVGNSFDYVEVGNAAGAGTYTLDTAGPDLTAPAAAITAPTGATATDPGTPAVANAPAGIYRSLAANGNYTLTPDGVIGACSDSSTNDVILGSR
ncbi:type II secretion system protein [Salmonella enterica subsp. enterica serovar Stanley]|nr:type II secretion system protein [Salmonella enterica subsp. enterica serovar Stanley]